MNRPVDGTCSTLGAHVLPGRAHPGSLGRASRPVAGGAQPVEPSPDVSTGTLIHALPARTWVENARYPFPVARTSGSGKSPEYTGAVEAVPVEAVMTTATITAIA